MSSPPHWTIWAWPHVGGFQWMRWIEDSMKVSYGWHVGRLSGHMSWHKLN